MKQISTLLFFAFFGFKSFALEREGRLTISFPTTQNSWVEVDGQRYSGYDNPVVITNLNAGNHMVKVYTRANGRRSSGVFGVFNSREKLIYSNYVNVKPGYNVLVDIDRYGKARVDEERIYKKNRRNGRGNDDWKYEQNRRGVNYEDFSRLRGILREEYSDNGRLTSAIQMSKNYAFSPEQVRQIMQLFNDDMRKVEFAKSAYATTTDKNDFLVVCDELHSRQSKQELEDFIRYSR